MLERFLYDRRPLFSEFSFSTLFMWNQPPGYRWQLFRDRLLIYSENLRALLLTPGDATGMDDLLALSNALIAQGRSGDMLFVPTQVVNENPELQQWFECQVDRANADYIYLTESLAELKGRRLQKKRNLIHQFLNLYPDYRVSPLSTSHFTECFRLAEKWCRGHTCQRMGYEHEFSALKRAFVHFSDLPLEGLLLEAGGQVAGFSIFSPLNDRTYIAHFEKADSHVKGSAQMINRETAKFLKPRAQYINREQDLGLPGLRKAKLSYCPDMILESFRLTRRPQT